MAVGATMTNFRIETGSPLPACRGRTNPLIEALLALPVATGLTTDQSILLPGVSLPSMTGIPYWQRKLGVKFRTHQTNKGLRVWSIGPVTADKP